MIDVPKTEAEKQAEYATREALAVTSLLVSYGDYLKNLRDREMLEATEKMIRGVFRVAFLDGFKYGVEVGMRETYLAIAELGREEENSK
jgi:hypothetical protein